MIPKTGVLASDLLNDNYSDYELCEGTDSITTIKSMNEGSNGNSNLLIYIIIIASVAVVLLVCFLLLKKRKAL